METQDIDELSRLMGFPINAEMRRILINEMKATGEDIRAVCAKRAMPEMAYLGSDNKFNYHGQRITVDEFEKINPLGSYAKIIVIRKRKNNETI